MGERTFLALKIVVISSGKRGYYIVIISDETLHIIRIELHLEYYKYVYKKAKRCLVSFYSGHNVGNNQLITDVDNDTNASTNANDNIQSTPTQEITCCQSLANLQSEHVKKIPISYKCKSRQDRYIPEFSKDSITAHYINNNWTLSSHLLECVKYRESHTGENLSKLLKDSAQEWGIENNITAITTDNASNIVKAIKLCNWRHIPCFAHTINLIVQSGINCLKNNILCKVKSIVEYFKRSSSALNRLREMQEQMKLPNLKLKQDVPTRWNFTYEMLKRILEIKEAVVATLALVNRFDRCEDNDLIMQATLLDPRFMKFGFITDKKCDQTVENLRNRLQGSQGRPVVVNVPVQQQVEPSESTLWKELDTSVAENITINPRTAAILNPLLERMEDPLKWWKEKQAVYPILSQFVKKRLCITGTSVPCERIFSKAGLILTERRYRLGANKMAQIMFLNHNLGTEVDTVIRTERKDWTTFLVPCRTHTPNLSLQLRSGSQVSLLPRSHRPDSIRMVDSVRLVPPSDSVGTGRTGSAQD
ncbi:hypothetical protein NQ317_015266 [Molorchus minor]|uniref:HAT C-terminal dimerisation domain-containing protein n=1 Tax=Molorchus minor TaxID=1323400 RepID=A0ABQ9IZ12_9CUCU|nr:hypothetical protein NQ317_015266 [Molorchus minor]